MAITFAPSLEECAVEGGVGCGDAFSSNPDIAPQR